MLIDADDLVDAAQRLGDPLAGTLRIGVIPTISPYLLPDLVRALARAHPRLTVRWTEDKTETLVRALARRRARRGRRSRSRPTSATSRARRSARDPFVLAAPRGHAAGAALHARDGRASCAARTCCCSTTATACATRRWRSAAARGTEELGFRATSLPTLAQMVAAGAGVTLLPALAVATESRRAPLVIRPLAERAFRTLGLVWRPTSPLAPALRTLAVTMRAAYPRSKPERSPRAPRRAILGR